MGTVVAGIYDVVMGHTWILALSQIDSSYSKHRVEEGDRPVHDRRFTSSRTNMVFMKPLVTVMLVLVAAVILPMIALFGLGALFANLGAFQPQNGGFLGSLLVMSHRLLPQLLAMGIVLLAWRGLHRGAGRLIHVDRSSVRTFVLAQLAGLMLAAICKGVTALWFGVTDIRWAIPESVGGVEFALTYFSFWLVFLTLNSIKEEYLFRAYALEAMKGQEPMWLVMTMSSALFALAHVLLGPPNLLAMGNQFLFGLLCCQIYIRRRSIWASIGFHNGWNWFMFSLSGDWRIGGLIRGVGFEDTSQKLWVHLVIQAVVLLAVVRWLPTAPSDAEKQL